jgi:hypothetical protein
LSAALWTVALSPVAAYFGFLLRFARNIPSRDDYCSVLTFLNDWLGRKDLGVRLGLLNAQYYSHRIAATRLASLADYALFGRVSFLHLQWIGWLAWGAVFALLMLAAARDVRTPLVAATVALLLMHPAGHTNLLIGMQAVENLGVIAVALLAVHAAASPQRPAWLYCAILVGAAPGVSANGLLVGLAAASVALACGRRRLAALLAGISAIAAGAFFHGYKPYSQVFSAAHFLEDVLVAVGSPFALLRLGTGFAMAFGAALILALGFFVLKPANWRRVPVLCGFAVFLGSTVAMLAYGRMNWGVDYVLNQDRYKAYGVLCCAALFLFCSSSRVARAFPRSFRLGAVGASACFCGFAYYNGLSMCRNDLAWEEASALNRQLGTWFIVGARDDWPGAIAALARAEKSGIYRLPSLLSAPEVSLLKMGSNAGLGGLSGPMRVESRPDGPSMGTDLVVKRRDTGDMLPRFALLASRNGFVFLPGMQPRMPLGKVARSLSLIANQEMLFLLPDALGVPVPGTLIGWPQ